LQASLSIWTLLAAQSLRWLWLAFAVMLLNLLNVPISSHQILVDSDEIAPKVDLFQSRGVI